MGAAALPLIATATTAASAGLGAYGQHQAGAAAKRAGRYAANAYNFDASVADQQAHDAIARGAEAAQRSGQATAGAIGTQRVGYAAQGVDVGSGSAADVQADSAALGALDQLTIRTNAMREAWGYGNQAQDFRNSAALARKGGTNAAQSGNLAAGATLLTGALDTYSTAQRYRSTTPSKKGGG